MKQYGGVREARVAGPRDLVWVAERPLKWGGKWALGCVVCAAAAARVATGDAERGQSRLRRGTAWSRYEVSSCKLQSEHIREHAEKDCHRVAVLAWIQPELPVPLTLQRSIEDDELLAGNVPQPPDWLRAWRATVSPASWRAAEKIIKLSILSGRRAIVSSIVSLS